MSHPGLTEFHLMSEEEAPDREYLDIRGPELRIRDGGMESQLSVWSSRFYML